MGTRGSLIVCLSAVASVIAMPVAGQQATASAEGNARTGTPQAEKLLSSAHIWKIRNNPDRERSELIKLLRTEPDHPQALLMLGLLEIRTEHIDAATKLLKQLIAAHPYHPAAFQLEEALRIAGTDRKKMAQIQLLARVGKNEEAAAGMRSLFPKGPPDGDLALAYYRVIGNTPTGWDEARNGLEKLVENEPDDIGYRIALALHLTHRPATRNAGMEALANLARRPDADRQQVLEAWARALVALDRSPDNIGRYLEYLQADPKNVAVRDALADAQRAEAERRPWLLRDKADALLKEGRVDEAVATLASALQFDPKNPWVRFDLSRLYYKRGSQKQGRELMEEGLVAAPDDPDMFFAAALYVGLMDEADNALRLLDKIPVTARTPPMQSFRKKMEIKSQTQQAQVLARSGRRADALAAMERVEAGTGDDAELVNIVANAWFDLDDSLQGVTLMRRLLEQQTAPSVASRLLYAGLLNRAGQNEELASLLDKLSLSGELSSKDKEDFRYLWTSLAARRADNRRNAADYAGARAALAPMLEQDPENTDLLMALARLHVAMHKLDEAQAVYRRILARTPGDVGARVALARVMNEIGDKAAAHREVDTILRNAGTDDLDIHMAVADVFIDMDDTVAARRIVERFGHASPGNPHVLVESGRLARAEGRLDEAMDYFRRAGANEEISRMERGRKGFVVTAGADYLGKSGTPGISGLKAIELPVEVRVPVGYAGQAFVHIDPVSVDAGNLQLDDLYNLRQYGKIQALAPGGIAGAPGQSAHGTAIALGYETADVRADIGTTPLGFPVSDVVGGLKISRSMAPFAYSFEMARRPVTSSLLSYAGARDPVTGEVWGGVRSNGTTLHIGYDRSRFNAFADLGYYLMTGKNVATNREFALRTGLDWEFIQQEDTRLSFGLVFTNWRYRENLRYYTFGHGGYYSPQSYYSFAVPFRWTGRNGRWSYLLRASVSASVSYEKDMPYYPTDPSLQATGNSVYAGGHGHGTGYSVGGALEYQIAPHLFAGGRFGIDRSAYYTPNFASLYLRYVFNAPNGTVPFPPDPVKPYSRF